MEANCVPQSYDESVEKWTVYNKICREFIFDPEAMIEEDSTIEAI